MIDYGFSCGRHWIEIDGKKIYQGEGADVYLEDGKVKELQALLVGIPSKLSSRKLFVFSVEDQLDQWGVIATTKEEAIRKFQETEYYEHLNDFCGLEIDDLEINVVPLVD